jgi:putative transposase
MVTSAFQQGSKIRFDNKCYILLRKVTDDLWQIEDSSTKRIHEYTDDQLRSFYASGKLTFTNSNAKYYQSNDNQNYLHISDEQFEQAKIRRAYVKAILNSPNTLDKLTPVIREIWEKIGKPDTAPNPVTVFRWKTKYIKAGNDIVSLVERHNMKGNKAARYPQEVTEFVQQAIDTIYLTLERNTVEDTYNRAYVLTGNENKLRPAELKLPLPTRRLVTRMIEAIPAFDRCVARHGHAEAIRIFRSVLAHRTTLAPLERAEIDHTPLDLIVIDDKTHLPLGRPWVTACIDNYTRCILGIHISFEPPSYLTVAHCLKDAFCPKVNLREKYPDIKNTWDAHGVMRELVVDNGLEFHSKSLENACYSLGIEIHYSPRKKPWFKGIIERFLGTLNKSIAHGTPGTTFSNIFDKKDYDPSKHAVVRMSKLQEIIHTWIADVYHQRPHRTLKIPPAFAWKSSIKTEDILLPDNLSQLDAILGRTEQRVLTHKGIQLNYLLYNSPELTDLRRQLGDKLYVDIRVNEADLGHIHVLSPDKTRIFKVPALFFDYANGLSNWQHRVCQNFAAREWNKDDPMSWRKAKEVIRKLIEEEFMHKKQKTNSKAARFKGEPATDVQPELPVQLSPSQELQEPTPDKHPIPISIPDDLPDPQLRPKKIFKSIYRERAPHLIEADQSESISELPQNGNT